MLLKKKETTLSITDVSITLDVNICRAHNGKIDKYLRFELHEIWQLSTIKILAIIISAN